MAIGATVVVIFFSLAGCGGSGSAPPPPPPNPTPSVANGSLNPTSAVAGGAAFTLTVNGSNFVSSSIVQWNGSARTTTFGSSTSLQASISSADVAAAGMATITVTTPAPGGGTSAALNFTIDNPMPGVSSLGPAAAFAGDAAFVLTVTGTNFVATSVVEWNGSERPTTFVSETSLQASISAADIALAGMASVAVVSPAPGGGASGALNFSIKVPPPKITLLNPSSAVAGGGSFMMTVTGKNFVSSSIVQWKGTALTTTFVSSTTLQAAVDSSDIAAIGAANVTVSNPPANGGISSPSTFFVGSVGGANFAVISLNQPAKDIVWDPINQVFYLSVTGTSATNANTICVLDPATGTITSDCRSEAIPALWRFPMTANFFMRESMAPEWSSVLPFRV